MDNGSRTRGTVQKLKSTSKVDIICDNNVSSTLSPPKLGIHEVRKEVQKTAYSEQVDNMIICMLPRQIKYNKTF